MFFSQLFFLSGNEWSEEEIDTFEMLTHCAQWKVLMARIESHHQSDEINGKFTPCVKLVDTNGEKVPSSITLLLFPFLNYVKTIFYKVLLNLFS